MIITNPKVVKYIEEFEAVKALNPLPTAELSGKEQKTLYTITEMFNIDEIFKVYISLLVHDFARKRTMLLGNKELAEILLKVVDLASSLNPKEGE